jgi:hypothetical protein
MLQAQLERSQLRLLLLFHLISALQTITALTRLDLALDTRRQLLPQVRLPIRREDHVVGYYDSSATYSG